jgi:hypothetical protein
MAYRPRPKQRDASEPNIVAALEAIGCSVVRLDDDKRSGLPDLLVGHRGQSWLIEVKNPEATRSRRRKSGEAVTGKAPQTSLSPAQETWHRGWRGRPALVVRTPQEAIAAVLGPVPTLEDVVRAAEHALEPCPCMEPGCFKGPDADDVEAA